MEPGSQRRVTARTEIVRVPRVDWPAIRTGRKTELRIAGRHATSWLHGLVNSEDPEFPRPIVCWSMRRYRDSGDEAMFWLDEAWLEPLGAISDESLRREGFDGDRTRALKQFRRYWRNRHQSVGFRPLSPVHVLRIRPLQPVEYEAAGLALLRRLYGGSLEE